MSVGEKKDIFIKKWGVKKLKAYFALVKMWDSIDGKKIAPKKHNKHMAKKQGAWDFDMSKFKDQFVNLMQWWFEIVYHIYMIYKVWT